jgi:hypothetical protein
LFNPLAAALATSLFSPASSDDGGARIQELNNLSLLGQPRQWETGKDEVEITRRVSSIHWMDYCSGFPGFSLKKIFAVWVKFVDMVMLILLLFH